jgi:hypothetical protein
VPVVIYLLVVCAISVGSVLLLPGRLGQADPATGPVDTLDRSEAGMAAPAV